MSRRKKEPRKEIPPVPCAQHLICLAERRTKVSQYSYVPLVHYWSSAHFKSLRLQHFLAHDCGDGSAHEARLFFGRYIFPLPLSLSRASPPSCWPPPCHGCLGSDGSLGLGPPAKPSCSFPPGLFVTSVHKTSDKIYLGLVALFFSSLLLIS